MYFRLLTSVEALVLRASDFGMPPRRPKPAETRRTQAGDRTKVKDLVRALLDDATQPTNLIELLASLAKLVPIPADPEARNDDPALASAIPVVVSLLGASHPDGVQVAAAQALVRFAAWPDMRDAVRAAVLVWLMAPGSSPLLQKLIPVLVQLMGPGASPLLQKFAAGSVMEIGDNKFSGNALVDEGGIPLLVHHLCLESGTQTNEYAAAALGNIALTPGIAGAIAAAGGIPALVPLLGLDRTTGVQESAALALSNMTRHANTRGLVAAAGAIPSLVGLLGKTVAYIVQCAAAGALKMLGNDEAGALAIARAGGVPALMGLMGRGARASTHELHETASRALAQMASSAVATRGVMRSAGAVPLFVMLLEPGTSPDVVGNVACGLACLCMDAGGGEGARLACCRCCAAPAEHPARPCINAKGQEWRHRRSVQHRVCGRPQGVSGLPAPARPIVRAADGPQLVC
ncbi:hypothetical protein FOA52_015140 [Chlamydomonas sp. UWO 241]|nr:hypothetical protein FOA52_015140 [Chlamydomonas sp. UWO 241]